jgi:hypothetical protein
VFYFDPWPPHPAATSSNRRSECRDRSLDGTGEATYVEASTNHSHVSFHKPAGTGVENPLRRSPDLRKGCQPIRVAGLIEGTRRGNFQRESPRMHARALLDFYPLGLASSKSEHTESRPECKGGRSWPFERTRIMRYRIVCTTQEPISAPWSHQHIVSVGMGTDPDQATKQWPLAGVIAAIDRGDEFYTRSLSTGLEAEVIKVACAACGQRWFIRTVADPAKDNNLDNLRRCRSFS